MGHFTWRLDSGSKCDGFDLGTPGYAGSRYEDLDGLFVVAGDNGPSDSDQTWRRGEVQAGGGWIGREKEMGELAARYL